MSDLRSAAEAVLDAWFRSGSKILEMQPHMERLAGALEQPPEKRNFCPRCGKRAIGDVHTCTPPQEEPAQERFCDTHCTWADHAPGCVRAEPLSVTVTELQEALVYTNLIDRDAIDDPDGYDEGSTLAQIDALHRKLTAAQGCNPHPKAPHGFLRNASHTEDRYVCECEYWDPYEAGYQAGMERAMQLQKDDDWK